MTKHSGLLCTLTFGVFGIYAGPGLGLVVLSSAINLATAIVSMSFKNEIARTAPSVVALEPVLMDIP
jgi:hypothetical protein